MAELVHNTASHVHADPRNFGLSHLFFRRVWMLVHPYWLRGSAWPSWSMVAIIVVAGAGYSLAGGLLSKYTADQANALVGREPGTYWHFWAVIIGWTVVRNAMTNIQNFFSYKLKADWRSWLSAGLIDRYLRNRTYYRINIDNDIDNPDQRIQDGVSPFCEAMTSIPQRLLTAVVDIGVQVVILMSISPLLFYVTLGYTAVQTVLTYLVYRPTIRQQWDSTIAEADFRYGLLHVRDNAETVAFYRGEDAESQHLLVRLAEAIKRYLIVHYYEIKTNIFAQAYSIIWDVLPLIVVAPLFFHGKIAFGQIAQATTAAIMIQQSLGFFQGFIPQLTYTAPIVVRLAEIQEKFERLEKERTAETAAQDIPRIRRETGSGPIVLTDVALHTPGGERTLIAGLTFTLPEGSRMLIAGQTGVGKSSLLRAIAGLWSRGTGYIHAPPSDQTLFLPQAPYMVLGDLRSQLLYPRQDLTLSDAELQALLERVRLPDLAERHGGFHVERDWGRLLSLGEQQRVAFARVLTNKPRYVFLDEATSAVDIGTEAHLYELVVKSGATMVSVAHRTSVLRYHDTLLDMQTDGCSVRKLYAPQQDADGGLEIINDDG